MAAYTAPDVPRIGRSDSATMARFRLGSDPNLGLNHEQTQGEVDGYSGFLFA